MLVRKQAKAIHIVGVDSPASAQGHLFLHNVDDHGLDYLDQQLRPHQHPDNLQEFQALVGHFVNRYQCPVPHRVYIEDAKTGAVLFSTDQP